MFQINNNSLCEDFIGEKLSVSDPLTIEFKRIFIVSRKFDHIGKSEVMIVNHIKTEQTKERSAESITYYDDDADVKNYFGNKNWEVGPFNSDQYGNSVIYHTAGYTGNNIIITTKCWELNSSDIIQSGINFVKSLINLSSQPSAEIIVAGLNIGEKILVNSIRHNKLCDDYTFELNFEENIYPGKYVIFPNSAPKNVANLYIKKGILYNKNGIEYNRTYFILKISINERPDLADFDYLASASELLQLLKKNTNQKIFDINSEAHEYSLIRNYIKSIKDGNIQLADALKKQIKKLNSSIDLNIFH